MAFCSSCGAQLEGDSHFCVKCGADQTAKAAAAPAAVAPPPPAQPFVPPPLAQPFAPPPPAQPFGIPPVPPVMPGQIPIVMGAPPQAPAKGKGWLWGVVAVAILYGLYYIGTHNQQNQNPGQAPTPQAQPGQPTPQTQPGAPTPQAQPGYQPQQPGGGGQGGGSQALVQAQQFSGRWDGVNGYVQISQAQWKNGANVVMQSATLECVQYAQSGQTITQNRTTLNGPAQPGQTITFPTFQAGQMAQGLAKVQCGIVGVTPAN